MKQRGQEEHSLMQDLVTVREKYVKVSIMSV